MVAFENLYRRSMFYLKWPSCRNLDLDKFTFLAWFGVLSFCYWGILFVCFVCFSFLFCPNIFLYSPPLDIDQLKLILRLVGTPGAELLKKISSESVSWCLDCNYLPCWEPLPLPFCQSVLWPGYVCKHMCPLCADSRMRCVCTCTCLLTCMSVFCFLSIWVQYWSMGACVGQLYHSKWDLRFSFIPGDGKFVVSILQPWHHLSQSFAQGLLSLFWLVFILKAWALPSVSLAFSLKEWKVHCPHSLALSQELLAFYCFGIDNLHILGKVCVLHRGLYLPCLQTVRGNIPTPNTSDPQDEGCKCFSHSLPV